jgi:hypothetical protein
MYDLWKIHFKIYYCVRYFDEMLRPICGCQSIALRQGRFSFQGAVTLKLKEFP